MSRRDNAHKRCPACRMHRALCVCALVPKLATTTRLIVVVHKEEERKPTNTGLLAARAVSSSRVVVVGHEDRPVTAPVIGDDDNALLLFPDADAIPLHALDLAAGPYTLVVPDGTWRQARKMAARVPGLARARRVSLPPGPASVYRLRTETKDGGLATLEAIARALQVLEGPGRGPAVEAALLAVFRVMVERTLWLRGALGDDEVTGGIPRAARACDPRSGGG